MAILFITLFSTTLYICTTGLYIYQLRSHTDRFEAASRILFFSALLTQSVSIGITSVSTKGTLLQGPNVLTLSSWVLAMTYIFFSMAKGKSNGYGAFVTPVVISMMLIAELMNIFDNGASLYNRVFNEWPMLACHLTLFFVALACFVISAVASAMLLYQQHLARRKSTDFLTVQMPDLSALKRIAGHFVCIGMPFFTAGILLGFARYAVLWGTMASMGCQGSVLYLVPRIIMSLLIWVAYCVFIILVYLVPGRVPSRTCSWLSIGAGIATVLLAILSSVTVM